MEDKIKKDFQIEKKLHAEKIVLDVMRHFGFRRNYQVANYFNVTPQTLSGWIKSGEIPAKHLIRYNSEINKRNELRKESFKIENNSITKDIHIQQNEREHLSVSKLKKIILNNFKLIFMITFLSTLSMVLYVFFFASPVYTSKSKVLPISEDGSTSNFSGFASQLGINIPLTIGGKVPWDEIYPEIIKSSDLLISLLNNTYETDKYGNISLEKILIKQHNLSKYKAMNQKNRVIAKFREMIKISKDRTSPIVNINVQAFEPYFASNLAKDLILKSSLIQRELKTNRVRQKRLFIEERLNQVSTEMKNMEMELRRFRENNRNLSSSPSLQMKVQEMGREVDLQNSLYVTLKTQYEKAKIDEVGRDDMVQQIDGPSIPTNLTSPKRGLSIAMAILFGLFSSFFTIYIKEI